jgi:hypothetical protein
MLSLAIPESGLAFGVSRNGTSKPGSVPDVFGLTLNDSVIEEMIRCVQNGKPIQLSLGEHPVGFLFTARHLEQVCGIVAGGLAIVVHQQ